MTVMKNKFISRIAAYGGQHPDKAAKKGKENRNAFCSKLNRMRFYFGPIADGRAHDSAFGR
jgi:hypothetical protein